MVLRKCTTPLPSVQHTVVVVPPRRRRALDKLVKVMPPCTPVQLPRVAEQAMVVKTNRVVPRPLPLRDRNRRALPRAYKQPGQA